MPRSSGWVGWCGWSRDGACEFGTVWWLQLREVIEMMNIIIFTTGIQFYLIYTSLSFANVCRDVIIGSAVMLFIEIKHHHHHHNHHHHHYHHNHHHHHHNHLGHPCMVSGEWLEPQRNSAEGSSFGRSGRGPFGEQRLWLVGRLINERITCSFFKI